LEPDLFYAGVRPAINVGISASRVGGKAQTKAMKKVAASLRLDLAQYRELAAFAQLGSEMDKATQAQLVRGERMVEILKQDKFDPFSLSQQVVILFAGTRGYLDSLPINLIKDFELEFYPFLEKNHPAILTVIDETKDLNEETSKQLESAVVAFKEQFLHTHQPVKQ
jgi:F-type H+-transporting ATPase subunit alpha